MFMKSIKRVISLLLVAVMLAGNIPLAAFAEESQPVCSGQADCLAQTHNEGCEKAAIDAKTAEDQAAADVVAALIEALPALEDIQAKPLEEAGPEYTQVNAAYDAYLALTEEQKALLSYGQDFFDPYLAYFSGQTQEAASNHAHPVCGTTCRCTESHDSPNWIAWDGTTKLYNGDYYLTRDVVLNSTMILDYSYSTRLCLNGYSITCTDTVFDIYSYRSLLITDCKGTGKVESTDSWPTIGNNKYLSVWGGTILNSADYGYAIDCYSGTTTFICGGNIESENSAAIFAAPGSTISIQGGTVHGDNSAINSNGGTGGVSKLTISGGRITSNEQYSATVYFMGSLTMTGGYVDGDVWSGDSGTSSAISGGTINGVLVDTSDSLTITGGNLAVGLESKQATILAGTFKGDCYFSGTGSTTITGGDFSNCDIVEVYNETWISGGSYSTIRVWGGKLYLSGVPDIKLLQIGTPSAVSAQNIDGTGSFGGDTIEVSFTNPYSSYVWKNGDVVIKDVKSDAVAEKFKLSAEWAENMGLERSGNNLVVRVWPHGNCGGNVNWRLENGTLIVSGSGAIPNYVGPFDSSGTKAPWFDIKSQIEAVYIEPGITAVGANAFNQCLNLKQVTLPEGITLNKYAFYDTGLTSVMLPERTVLEGRDSIFGYSPITKITIPGSAVLTPYGFSYCKNVTELTLGEGLEDIPYATFMRCEALEKVIIPASVNQVGDWAFENCLCLKEVVFKGEAPTFGSNVFRGATMTAYYPAGDETWTQDEMQNYGGAITWIATCGNHSYEGAEPGYTWSEDYSQCTAYLNCINDGCQVKQSETVNSTVVTDEASCTEDGQTTYTAIFASDIFETQTKGIRIPGGHSFVEGVCEHCGAQEDNCAEGHSWKDATCTASKTCSVCGATEGEPLGHTCDREVVDTKYLKEAGNCQTASVYYKSCVCGEPGEETFTGALGNHIFSEGICTVCGLVASGKCGENLTWTLDKDGLLTIFGIGAMYDYAEYNNNAPWRPTYTKDIKKVVIGAGVTHIGSFAFWQCDYMTQITIPDTVQSLGDGVFYGCNALTSVTIPDGVARIGQNVFYDCTSMMSIHLPESITYIGASAFVCSGLRYIVLPASVTTIDGNAFGGCDKLWHVLYTGTEAEKARIQYINPDQYLQNAKWHCSANGNEIDPADETTCTKVTRFSCTICNAVCEESVYGGVHSWQDATCTEPKTCSVCGEKTGNPKGHTYDREVVDVKYLKEAGNCQTASVYYKSCACGQESATDTFIFGELADHNRDANHKCVDCGQIGGFCGNPGINEGINVTWEFNKETGLITISGNGAMEDYNFNSDRYPPWYNYRNHIRTLLVKQGVTNIGSEAFYEHVRLSGVVLPETLVKIGYWAFSFCESLTEIKLPEGMKTIESHAFYNCANLENITLPESLEEISNNVFSNCSSLTSIEIPANVSTIQYGAFYECSNLESIVIPDDITKIEDATFYGCKKLESVVIPESVAEIGDAAFYECSSLKYIAIPKAVTVIGENAFNGCSGITSFQLPDDMVDIDTCAFANCSGLTSINIPHGLAVINTEVFANCKSLTSIEIPENIIKIDDHAFYGCSGLTKIVIPDSVARIGAYAFKRCSGLTSIEIPESVTNIGDDAFVFCDALTDVYFAGQKEAWEAFDVGLTEKTFVHYECTDSTEHWVNDTKDPTCGETGYIREKCVCGYTRNEVPQYPTGEHIYDQQRVHEDYLVSMPTCQSAAVYKKSCICGAASDTDTFYDGEPDPNNHTGNNHTENAEEATCTKEGYSGDTICECGEVVVQGEKIEKAKHSFGSEKGSLKTVGTCMAEAVYAVKCDNCTAESADKTVKGVKDPDNHTGNNHTENAEEATCTKEGYTGDTVCECGKKIAEGETIIKKTHSYTAKVTVATCTETGYTTYTCSACKDSYVDTYVDAIGHKLGEWKATKEATCNAKGEERRNCDSCDHFETRATEVDESNHVGDTEIRGETTASCTVNGYSGDVHCSTCGGKISDGQEITAPGHDMGDWEKIGVANCITKGKECRGCNSCDYEETREDSVNPYNHTGDMYEVRNEIQATCANAGYSGDTYCLTCGGMAIRGHILPESDHSWGAWEEATPSTCIEKGTERRDCYNCDRFEIRETEVDTSNHVGGTGVRNAKAATCTEAGYTGDTYCKCCDVKIATGEKTGTAAHMMGQWRITKEATCKATGEKRRECSNCDHFETEAIPVIDHAYTAVVTAPTCTYDGYTTYTCSCGDSYVDDAADALDHAFSEWTVVKEATPAVKGEEKRVCSRCDHTEMRTIEYEGNVLAIASADLLNTSSVWIDGAQYAVVKDGDACYINLPEGNVTNMVSYSYNVGDPEDIHTQYPTGMRVWLLTQKEDGTYFATYVKELDNILQYSGSSIRITGNKGIRMITSVTKDNKAALTDKGLAGYKLMEYGTALCWAKDLEGGKPMVLGQKYVKSNYAYKKGVADPVFAYAGSLVQYTNVLVGFSLDQCKDDIAMRPYMILEDSDGDQLTIYGGIVYRSIGYIAYQNRNVFKPGNASYDYVWEIIHHVYGKKYDSDYKG